MGVSKIGVPQNGWFIAENPIKWMIWGYHDFWKHPYRGPFFSLPISWGRFRSGSENAPLPACAVSFQSIAKRTCRNLQLGGPSSSSKHRLVGKWDHALNRCISHITWKKNPPNHLCFQGKQGSLYYQPKQCIVIREIPQNCHRFVLFDSLKMGNLMTTGKFHNFSPFQRTRRDRLRTCHSKWG